MILPTARGSRPFKKDREWAFLQEIQELYPSFPPGIIEDADPPDFFVRSDDATIAVEIVDYLREQSSDGAMLAGGSALRRSEVLSQRVGELARAEYERVHGEPLYVLYRWIGRSTRATDVDAIASALARLVARFVPDDRLRMVPIPRDQIEGTPLAPVLASVSVMRLDRGSYGLWSSTEAGFTGVGIEEVQALISSKTAKLDAYRRSCQQVWLIIVADASHISSHASLSDEVRGHRYQGDFDKVLFYSRGDRNVTQLNCSLQE